IGSLVILTHEGQVQNAGSLSGIHRQTARLEVVVIYGSYSPRWSRYLKQDGIELATRYLPPFHA
ncbi:MAG TPA: hypothetical protein VEQ63_16045, partial [Bryobacteraceae bacterium]|nr:hypothetical protein [Bryobacteraceae bacterium]